MYTPGRLTAPPAPMSLPLRLRWPIAGHSERTPGKTQQRRSQGHTHTPLLLIRHCHQNKLMLERETSHCHRTLLRIWIDLIATCKQLVWSIRIGRNMPIWVLCLIPGSGPGADLPLEVTGCGVRSLLYVTFPERPWVVLLSTLLLLSYLSLSLGLSFFRLLCLSGWGRVFIGWVMAVSTQGVIWASVEASDPVAPPLNLVLYMHLRTFA